MDPGSSIDRRTGDALGDLFFGVVFNRLVAPVKVQASKALAEKMRAAPMVPLFRIHEFKSNACGPSGEVSKCIVCGVEVLFELDGEERSVISFRRSSSDDWQSDRIPCHEQTSLFGGV